MALVGYREAPDIPLNCAGLATQPAGAGAMINGDSAVVLGSQIAALIVVLHNQGLVNAHAVKDQFAAGIEFQPEYSEALRAAVQRMQSLADALPIFEPQIPTTISTPQTD